MHKKPPAGTRTAPRPARHRVLLLDDRAQTRRLRAGILSTHGYEVDSAADLGEARRLWESFRYDLILIHMLKNPHAGWAFCEELRNADPPQHYVDLRDRPYPFVSAGAVDPSLRQVLAVA